MKYTFTAPMRPYGAIGLFYARSIEFASESQDPESLKNEATKAMHSQRFELGTGDVYVINESGDYVYPVGFK
jgi:acyl-CoA synthetase (NDP forming)